MKDTLLIKHAVGGRGFVDSSKQPVSYQIEEEAEEWRFTVQIPADTAIRMDEILTWKEELNVFVFRTYDDGRPTLKLWYSVVGNTVQYNEAGRKLTFRACSCIEYVPMEFGYKQ